MRAWCYSFFVASEQVPTGNQGLAGESRDDLQFNLMVLDNLMHLNCLAYTYPFVRLF